MSPITGIGLMNQTKTMMRMLILVYHLEDNEESLRMPQSLLEDASKMALRNIPAAVRTPYFSVHNDAENYFYSLLVQYVPFDKESELLERYPNSRDAFLDREKKFFGDENPFLSSIRERSNQLENAFRQAQALEILQNPEDYVPEEITEEVPFLNMTDEQFRDAQNAMNVQQRELLNIIPRGIGNQMREDSSRFLIFVTGGAGIGKTFTFNTLKEKVNRIYKKNVVKIAALTGVADILVGGSTLHSNMLCLNFKLN
ncbi:ATP-dependent DNA helicase [Nephila pilipes]|uniref:ATP-dependent DNA helicase n=1 Tax=Nephila pilipes TaxID=299642 RepID=A0A8X6TTH5_NEPPI|nr:ATP-dependent DNA helicase [Nephila pilipes]